MANERTERDERGSTPAAQPIECPWAAETMRIINNLTPDISGKAFDPDWFLLRQRLEEFERGVSATGETPQAPSVEQLCDELRHEVDLLTPKEWLWSLAYEPDKPMPPEVYLSLMKQYADYRLGPIVERIRNLTPINTAQAPARTDAPHEIEVLRCKHCRKLAISVDGIRQDTNSCAEEGHGDGKCAGQWTVLVKSAWLAARGKEDGR